MDSIKKSLFNPSKALLAALIFLFGASGFCETELQDPTRPSAYIKIDAIKGGEMPLNLQAVFIRDTGNQAVINGELVRVGDQIANLRIYRISQNKVQLGSGDGARELLLRPRVLTTPKLGE